MSEREFIKVLITGTFAAGKTSFINAISEYSCVSTEIEYMKGNSPESYHLDFGRLTVGEDRFIYLFANSSNTFIPDPVRWVKPNLKQWKHHLAYLLIVDHRTIDSEGHDHSSEINALIEAIQARNAPYVLLANKRKDVAAYSLTEMRMRLGIPRSIPFFEANLVTNPASAKQVLVELFKLLPQDELVLAAIEKLSE